jgi:hypothetical protein
VGRSDGLEVELRRDAEITGRRWSGSGCMVGRGGGRWRGRGRASIDDFEDFSSTFTV